MNWLLLFLFFTDVGAVKYYAHRGNTEGRDESRENDPSYLLEALAGGFEVEADVWYDEETVSFWFGYEEPMYEFPLSLVSHPRVLVRAMDIVSLNKLMSLPVGIRPHVYYHKSDDDTLTSEGKIWSNCQGTESDGFEGDASIAAMNEFEGNLAILQRGVAHGICSDDVSLLKMTVEGGNTCPCEEETLTEAALVLVDLDAIVESFDSVSPYLVSGEKRWGGLAVISILRREETKRALQGVGILDLIDMYLCIEDGSDLYDLAMNMWDVDRESTLVLTTSRGSTEALLSGAGEIVKVGKTVHVSQVENEEPRINILIPMAGLGSRFSRVVLENGNPKYPRPKPLIDVMGKEMIRWATENMTPTRYVNYRFIFVVRSEHLQEYPDLREKLVEATGRSAGGTTIIEVSETTEGAACTALLAEELIDGEDDALLMGNSDQFIEWGKDATVDDFIDCTMDGDTDGCWATFLDEGRDPKFSYIALEDGVAVKFAEKEGISNFASTGLYLWRRGVDFIESAKSMIEKNDRVNGEFYVAPTFSEMIAGGGDKRVKSWLVGKMWNLGDPESLDTFLQNYEATIQI